MRRREFLSGSAAVLAASASLAQSHAETPLPAAISPTESASAAAAARIPRVKSPGVRRGEMLYRQLGSTGVEVSLVGLGGSKIGRSNISDAEAIRLTQQAIDRGINFLDNGWDYNDGQSEQRTGAALAQAGYRQKAFLMTKIDGRTKTEAARQLEMSLRRLQTDHIDLLQFHEVIRFDDADRIFHSGGAMEAVLDAQKAGKVRFIGFTGHKDPRIHLYMLEVADRHSFHFDALQMPINVMDAHFRSFAQLVVPQALQRGIGVLGMKCFAAGHILRSGVIEPMDCLKFCLNVPVSVQITDINSQMLLDQAFAAVKQFVPMKKHEVASLISKTEQAAISGEFEPFKTTATFDATARRTDWLG